MKWISYAWSVISVVSDTFENPWTVACQAPLSMGFSRQEYWSGLPCPSPLRSDLKCHLLRKTFPDFPILSHHSCCKNSQHLLSLLIASITVYHMYTCLLISIIYRNICLIATSSFLNMQVWRSGSCLISSTVDPQWHLKYAWDREDNQ